MCNEATHLRPIYLSVLLFLSHLARFFFFLTLQASFIGLFTFLRSTDNPPTILYPTLDSTKRHYNFTLANGTTKIPQSGPCHRLLKGWNRACTVRPS